MTGNMIKFLLYVELAIDTSLNNINCFWTTLYRVAQPLVRSNHLPARSSHRICSNPPKLTKGRAYKIKSRCSKIRRYRRTILQPSDTLL